MSKREVKLFKSGSFHAQKIETKEKKHNTHSITRNKTDY
jgi:hypothetical protein